MFMDMSPVTAIHKCSGTRTGTIVSIINRLHLQEYILRSALSPSYVKLDVESPKSEIISESTLLVDRSKRRMELITEKGLEVKNPG